MALSTASNMTAAGDFASDLLMTALERNAHSFNCHEPIFKYSLKHTQTHQHTHTHTLTHTHIQVHMHVYLYITSV
jgi:hypothetical protein